MVCPLSGQQLPAEKAGTVPQRSAAARNGCPQRPAPWNWIAGRRARRRRFSHWLILHVRRRFDRRSPFLGRRHDGPGKSSDVSTWGWNDGVGCEIAVIVAATFV